MRYLTVQDFGTWLGVEGARLIVWDREGRILEESLSRLRAIRIEKRGVSISSDLVLECAARGIRIFFIDWRGHSVSTVINPKNQHAVVKVREAQFMCFHSPMAAELSAEIIRAKVRNERAVLLYFAKGMRGRSDDRNEILSAAAGELKDNAERIADIAPDGTDSEGDSWRGRIMGIEGISASIYWNALAEAGLLPESFTKREGRGATERTNASLNYGYAILQSYVWAALDNAGFELYEGVLHTDKPGKPSLVLDFMEEYRAWVVDRIIIKLRGVIGTGYAVLDPRLRRRIASEIDSAMQTVIKKGGSRVKLENAMQRQAYRLSGAVVGEKKYKGISFSW